MDELVLEHARPVEPDSRLVRRRERDDPARAAADGADVRHADQPGAEPAVAAGVSVAAEDLDRRPAAGRESEDTDDLGVDRVLEPARRLPRECGSRGSNRSTKCGVSTVA